VLIVEWGRDLRGRLPALKIFTLDLDEGQRVKMRERFQRLADFGRIENRDQFKQLGPKARGEGRYLWEFKIFKVRFFGDFRKRSDGRRRFVVVHGLADKKSDKLRQTDVDTAARLMKEHDDFESRQRQSDEKGKK
jgi:hypothetical protein